jgi:hypothetical protein
MPAVAVVFFLPVRARVPLPASSAHGLAQLALVRSSAAHRPSRESHPAQILLHALGYGQKKHDIGPLAKDDIDALPLVLFVPAEEEVAPAPAASDAPGADAVATTPAPVAPTAPIKTKTTGRRRRLVRLLWSPARRKRRAATGSADGEKSADGPYGATPYPLHPLPSNLSTCPICLCGALLPSSMG